MARTAGKDVNECVSALWLAYPSVAAAYRGESCGAAWILAVCVRADGQRPLVLLSDMQHLNAGASLTNTVEFAVARTFEKLLGSHARAPDEADWVELDSAGHFDLVRPAAPIGTNGAGARPTLIAWSPLTAGPTIMPRTLRAFVARFGRCAEVAWEFTQTLACAATAHRFETRPTSTGEVQRLVAAANAGALPR